MDIKEMIEYFESIIDDCSSHEYTLDSESPIPDLKIKDLIMLVNYLREHEGMGESENSYNT